MYKIILLIVINFIFLITCKAQDKPRVFIFTDINIDAGNPDDRQSLIHLLWYADELDIQGIVPERWHSRSIEASNMVIDSYEKDYSKYSFSQKNYPPTERIRSILANNIEEAYELFHYAISDTSSPLYVLVWGNMSGISELLLAHPRYSKNVRLITIGTGLMLERDLNAIPSNWEKSKPCEQLDWNGFGRNAIYKNPQFNDLWWLEMNWSYSGMFTGNEPKDVFHQLSIFGSMGKHIEEVVKNENWAQYFRVGDTPSVLYLIDPNKKLDDPTKSSWAGKFTQPFPTIKPNYFTDYNGTQNWDYFNPCATWENHELVKEESVKTLTSRRPEMYHALLNKLNFLCTTQ